MCNIIDILNLLMVIYLFYLYINCRNEVNGYMLNISFLKRVPMFFLKNQDFPSLTVSLVNLMMVYY